MQKINQAIQQLNQQNQKITQPAIVKLSGLSRSTVQRYWKKESPESESPHIKKESPESESPRIKKESPEIKKASSDAFRHFLRRH